MNEPPLRDEQPHHGAPPIPPPSAYSCYNCGLAMTEQPQYCPRCGSRLEQRTRSAGCWNTGFAVLLGMLAVPSALGGACFLVVGASEGMGSGSWQFTLVGLLGLGIAILCIWGIVKLNKAKRG